MNEKIHFTQQAVTITQSEFIVKDRVYPIDKIEAISFRELEPRRWLSLLCLMSGLVLAVQEDRLFALGGLLLTVGVVLGLCAKYKFAIVLRMPQGERKALVSEDSAYIEQIVNVLQAAVHDRAKSRPLQAHKIIDTPDDHAHYPAKNPPALE